MVTASEKPEEVKLILRLSGCFGGRAHSRETPGGQHKPYSCPFPDSTSVQVTTASAASGVQVIDMLTAAYEKSPPSCVEGRRCSFLTLFCHKQKDAAKIELCAVTQDWLVENTPSDNGGSTITSGKVVHKHASFVETAKYESKTQTYTLDLCVWPTDTFYKQLVQFMVGGFSDEQAAHMQQGGARTFREFHGERNPFLRNSGIKLSGWIHRSESTCFEARVGQSQLKSERTGKTKPLQDAQSKRGTIGKQYFEYNMNSPDRQLANALSFGKENTKARVRRHNNEHVRDDQKHQASQRAAGLKARPAMCLVATDNSNKDKCSRVTFVQHNDCRIPGNGVFMQPSDWLKKSVYHPGYYEQMQYELKVIYQFQTYFVYLGTSSSFYPRQAIVLDAARSVRNPDRSPRQLHTLNTMWSVDLVVPKCVFQGDQGVDYIQFNTYTESNVRIMPLYINQKKGLAVKAEEHDAFCGRSRGMDGNDDGTDGPPDGGSDGGDHAVSSRVFEMTHPIVCDLDGGGDGDGTVTCFASV